jgi:hypothetical protein
MAEQPVQKQEDQNRRETTAAELIRAEARDETAHWTLHENTSPSEITSTRRAPSGSYRYADLKHGALTNSLTLMQQVAASIFLRAILQEPCQRGLPLRRDRAAH